MNLVTGATGILGSHVVLHLLQNGEQVVATRQKNSELQKVQHLFSCYIAEHRQLFDRIKWVETDVRDIFSVEEALGGITNVYHCAGFVSFASADRKKLKEVNEWGTRNMVNACLNRPGLNFCHVSSIATINNLDHKLMLDESVFWKTSGNESDYAISKYNAEREVWRAMEEGLHAVIVNPGVILGPGYWDQSSGRLFKRGFKGNHFYTDGNACYVAAQDVAMIMHQLMANQLFGNRYILIENNYSYSEIFTMINAGFGRPAPGIKVGRGPLTLARWMEECWKGISGKERILSKALINAAFNKQVFSNKKIKEALRVNFKPTREIIEYVSKKYII